MFNIIKYPRTPHLQGSRLQPGDEDLRQRPFSNIADRHIVVEEKIDGANSAVSFTEDGQLLLQSRGHYLTGGYRERHYNLMKQWAAAQKDALFAVLGSRYIMYGEWMYAKHTIYYDALPHYFMEFDILDRRTDTFLDTPSRHRLLNGLPVCSVPVLASGTFGSLDAVIGLLGDSRYITPAHLDHLREDAEKQCLDAGRVLRETDAERTMEGLYIKVEENDHVIDRMKYVRTSFLQTVEESQTHWLDRPIVPNRITIPLNGLFV
ncbi:MAG: RNA ligase family protein [Paludibacteraceae bacterium]|nr:RNA ligase family protein [Paludibacteraceae bacterium]